MKAPDRWSRSEHGDDHDPMPTSPDVPTVYPIDDHVEESLLGPDGEPLTHGRRRQHPIGFGR